MYGKGCYSTVSSPWYTEPSSVVAEMKYVPLSVPVSR